MVGGEGAVMLLAFLRWSIPDILSLSSPLHFTGLQDPSLPFLLCTNFKQPKKGKQFFACALDSRP